jgi:hypothetical protein
MIRMTSYLLWRRKPFLRSNATELETGRGLFEHVEKAPRQIVGRREHRGVNYEFSSEPDGEQPGATSVQAGHAGTNNDCIILLSHDPSPLCSDATLFKSTI